ncbi:MAG: hypothetical protein UW38_C0001G0688 [Candidatus Saccharibacteria bacterium GW2011_GWC2_44_17]|nr:MAG: hypothetical protein UW38_C0001G0688 [Candidatus Saccharibacteria bacterium GW2011_GWC2_44_17]
MSDIKAYTVDINLGVKAGLSFVTEQRSLLRFQFYSGYTKSQNHFHSSDFVCSSLAPHTGHGTITWVAGHEMRQMRHKTHVLGRVSF